MVSNTFWRHGAVLGLSGLAAAILVACGGGGNASPAAATAASVSGVAATGAAIRSGSVTLKCVSGTTATTTTGTDGSFTVDVSAVTLPCVGRVSYTDGAGATQTLHTFVSAAGTANITPFTEMLVANLTGGTPAAAFDSFDAAAAKAVTATQVSTAVAAVRTYLAGTLGVDITNFPADPVTGKFVAANGSTAGDAADKVLDDLGTKLKNSGKKLSDATTELSKKSGSSTGGATGTVSFKANAAGKGPYAGVTAANNQAFLDSLAAHCTLDKEFTDGDHVVYRNCLHDAKDIKTNLVLNMYLGGLPNASNTVVSGPGVNTKSSISASSGITDAVAGNSCKMAIAEPVIPIWAIEVQGKAYTGQLGAGSFSFNGTKDDSVYVDTATTMVLQFTMTDGKGNNMMVTYDTTKGTAGANMGKFDDTGGGKWIACQ